ncbi:MAG: YHS domain-containing protein [Chloroflexi bacterium]|mgnify:CR=1 FL=1|nr:YHS domain-containing protein [Chloroflexota bacterium]
MAQVTDPVCGMTVVTATTRQQSEYQGQTYYFCTPGCKKLSIKNLKGTWVRAIPPRTATPVIVTNRLPVRLILPDLSWQVATLYLPGATNN